MRHNFWIISDLLDTVDVCSYNLKEKELLVFVQMFPFDVFFCGCQRHSCRQVDKLIGSLEEPGFIRIHGEKKKKESLKQFPNYHLYTDLSVYFTVLQEKDVRAHYIDHIVVNNGSVCGGLIEQSLSLWLWHQP